jgi:integrase
VAEWPDIIAGRSPKQAAGDATVAEVVNSFLTEKRRKVDACELSARTWSEYYATCKEVLEGLGRDRSVAGLRPEDLAKLRAKAAARLAPWSLLTFVTRSRMLFDHAYDFDLIPAPVKYGSAFARPPKKAFRAGRAKKRPKLLDAGELRTMLDAADPQLRAMILLGLNGGLGATDCAQLTTAVLRVKPGWLDYPRAKTGQPRMVPLWPETVAALAAAAKVRPAPKDPADADLVFLTPRGRPWVRPNCDETGKRGSIDGVAAQFRKLAARAGVELPSGFYLLRHVFRTYADEVHDRPAVDLVMGHSDNTMADHYRERIADERLLAVVNHVRVWFLAGTPSGGRSAGD